MYGFIKKGKKTEQHQARLEAKGYKVTENEDDLVIEIGGFHTEEVDLNTEEGAETVRQVVADKKAFTYTTMFQIPGEPKPLSGIFACDKLGALSCLIMRAPAAEKKDPVDEAMKSVLGSLGF